MTGETNVYTYQQLMTNKSDSRKDMPHLGYDTNTTTSQRESRNVPKIIKYGTHFRAHCQLPLAALTGSNRDYHLFQHVSCSF